MRAARRDECSIHHRSSQPHGIRVAPKQAVGSRSGLSHDGLSTGKRRLTMRCLATLTVAVLVSLAVPAVASAHRHTTVSPIVAAQERAASFWHATPCLGHVTVRVEVPTEALYEDAEAEYGREIVVPPNGWAEWQSPNGPESKEPPATSFTAWVVVLEHLYVT